MKLSLLTLRVARRRIYGRKSPSRILSPRSRRWKRRRKCRLRLERTRAREMAKTNVGNSGTESTVVSTEIEHSTTRRGPGTSDESRAVAKGMLVFRSSLGIQARRCPPRDMGGIGIQTEDVEVWSIICIIDVDSYRSLRGSPRNAGQRRRTRETQGISEHI